MGILEGTVSRLRRNLIFARAVLAMGAAGALAVPGAVPAEAPVPAPEYQIKAAFLFHFAQFVEWPPRAFPAPEAPLVIGIAGDDPFGPFLDNLVRGETVGGRKMVIQRFAAGAEITECQIIFIAHSEAHAARLLAALRGRSILTVGDAETFNREGGMIRFVTEAGKIRMHINLAAAKAAGLEISSKLLRPATIVAADQD